MTKYVTKSKSNLLNITLYNIYIIIIKQFSIIAPEKEFIKADNIGGRELIDTDSDGNEYYKDGTIISRDGIITRPDGSIFDPIENTITVPGVSKYDLTKDSYTSTQPGSKEYTNLGGVGTGTGTIISKFLLPPLLFQD